MIYRAWGQSFSSVPEEHNKSNLSLEELVFHQQRTSKISARLGDKEEARRWCWMWREPHPRIKE